MAERRLEPERISATPPDGVPLQLRRLSSPGPPVLLVHGASAQHETFLTPRGSSLAEFLMESGFEPWLLDWRGSCRVTDACGPALLEEKREIFDFDHAAAHDLPWALDRIEAVRSREGRPGPVQVIGHCMGAGVLAQALASGAVEPKRLRRIVLLTLGLFYEPPLDGRLKSQDRVLDRLWRGGAAPSIDPRVPETEWPEELREIYEHWAPSLRPHPHGRIDRPSSHELCDRVSLMYGMPYRERNLVPEIHGVRRIRFANGTVEPGRGVRIWAVAPGTPVDQTCRSGRMGFVREVEKESGSWRREDATGVLDLSGALGTFPGGCELRSDDGNVVALCHGDVSDRPAELGQQFGSIPLRMYLQGAQNVRRRWAGPFDDPGHEAWIGQEGWERFRALEAVTLVTGARNQLWHRDSMDRMAEWLTRGPRRPRCAIHKEVLADYAHQDLLWGMESRDQVFPIIRMGLDDSLGLPAWREPEAPRLPTSERPRS